MHLLERHGEIAMSRLAEMLDVSDSAATGLIDRIEERGFVERIRVPEDRRIVLVRITPVGLQTLEDVERSRTELLGHALDQLDPSQIEGIATAMAALRVALLASHSDPISGVQHSHQPHREGLTP
jgi:DNA-binding MarR family transcriptional regulator